MTRWEYARLESSERSINVVFTHRQAWTGIAPDAFFQTLGRLGDEGWELVAALPLLATASAAQTAAATTGAAGTAGVPDPRERRDPRDPRPAPPSSPTPLPLQPMTLQVSPDRWLVFKRLQPEPGEEQGIGPAADVIKGLVGRRLLKGGLPLP
jgi:hypothetical protein